MDNMAEIIRQRERLLRAGVTPEAAEEILKNERSITGTRRGGEGDVKEARARRS